jgi:hypothetical protein
MRLLLPFFKNLCVLMPGNYIFGCALPALHPLRLQHWAQTASPLQSVEFIAAAYMLITDPNLGHAGSSRPPRHVFPKSAITIHRNLFKRNVFTVQQPFGSDAVGAPAGGVDNDLSHHLLTIGSFSAVHSIIPPVIF